MIKSFKDKGLAELFNTGRARKVPANLTKRVVRILDVLNGIKALPELEHAGLQWHRLVGPMAGREAINVNGPWRLTFRWDAKEGNAYELDLVQYH